MLEENSRLLQEVSQLMPNQGISIVSFSRLYAGLSLASETECDAIVNQVLIWYRASVRVLIEEKERIAEEKERIIEEKERVIEEKERVIEEKQRHIEAKDDVIVGIKESSDIAKALTEIVQKPKPVQKWGTVTRSQAWDTLVNKGAIQERQSIGEQVNKRKIQLVDCFNAIDPSLWNEKIDMYPDIIKAIDKGLYEEETGIFVVDTHSKGEFHADISVAHQEDDRLPYCLRYFIELKIREKKLKTAENCGQILDYFNAVHERQPYRSEFVAILSNFDSSLVFIASYDRQNNITIFEQWADTIADAVIFADHISNSQYSIRLPELDDRFGSQYSILAVSRHHYLLSLSQPKPSPAVVHTHTPKTRSKVKSSLPKDDSWRNPSRHTFDSKRLFVLKIVRGQTSVANEIAVLRRLQDAHCPHLPEIVWTPSGERELGIVPLGMPIDFRQPQTTSRRIVQCLIDGLEFLHKLGIVHRDIRTSNLILDYTKASVNVVIIDYETAVVVDDVSQGVEYHGGFISWPKRLIENNTLQYIPKPEDDLFASILLVLHMLFPLRFDAFRASNIRVGHGGPQETPSLETLELKRLWDDIEKSRIWEPFVKAAKARDYELLKGMADVFCHV